MDRMLKLEGLKINRNKNTTEADITPNILNRSKGTPFFSSNIKFGLLPLVRLQSMVRVEIEITMLRII